MRLIGRAIALSLPALASNPRELPRQLFGRLGNVQHKTAASVAEAARQDMDFPRPRWPGLTPPEAVRLLMVGHEAGVTSSAFSPDGARIVTASHDRTARLWDAVTGAEITVLHGHENAVNSAAFSPDRTRIVTASDDRTLRLWEAATGKEIADLRGHESWVNSAVFSPDGGRFVTASYDSTARLWDSGQEITSIVLDVAVTALAVGDYEIALSDALGRIHVFETGERIP